MHTCINLLPVAVDEDDDDDVDRVVDCGHGHC
jgi:hypothetical protein